MCAEVSGTITYVENRGTVVNVRWVAGEGHCLLVQEGGERFNQGQSTHSQLNLNKVGRGCISKITRYLMFVLCVLTQMP